MKYVVLVSHGEFAKGLANALSMLAGHKEEVLAIGLTDGASADEFASVFEQTIAPITQADEIILLGDLIGGSPLTTAMNVIASRQMTDQCVVIGGMNLPLALTVVLMKDALDKEALVEQVLAEAQGALKELKVSTEEEEEI